jgi:hypothetical protein
MSTYQSLLPRESFSVFVITTLIRTSAILLFGSDRWTIAKLLGRRSVPSECAKYYLLVREVSLAGDQRSVAGKSQ